jgi:hypothetical protein
MIGRVRTRSHHGESDNYVEGKLRSRRLANHDVAIWIYLKAFEKRECPHLGAGKVFWFQDRYRWHLWVAWF